MTICPYYNPDSLCDCPYSHWDRLAFTCPPAEKIKEDIIDAWIEAAQEARR